MAAMTGKTQRLENTTNGTGFLTRDAIRQIQDLKTEEVDVPEWGGKVLVRSMTGEERDAFEASNIKGKGKNRDINLLNYKARLVIWCVVDGDGQRIFGEPDAEWLGKKSSAALNRIVDVAQRLSGVTDSDVEELVGELKNDRNGTSGSA